MSMTIASQQQQHAMRRAILESRGATKYHRAALEGYLDLLWGASKRDTNAPTEEAGLTPTLVAAQCGHLEALRMLVGRGGDPERADAAGNTCLHLAASQNHLNCVSFLVNFGVNMWALDNEWHTAKDVAALNQRKETLDYLEQMMSRQSAVNTKQVQKLKYKAKRNTEKRLKELRKSQLKAIKQNEREEKQLFKVTSTRPMLKAAHSISDIKLVGNPLIKYSPAIGNSGQQRLIPLNINHYPQAGHQMSIHLHNYNPHPLAVSKQSHNQQIQLNTRGSHFDLSSSYLSNKSHHSSQVLEAGPLRADGYDSAYSAGSSIGSMLSSKVGHPLTKTSVSSSSGYSILSSSVSAGSTGSSSTGNSKSAKLDSVVSQADSLFSKAAPSRPRYSDLVAITNNSTTKDSNNNNLGEANNNNYTVGCSHNKAKINESTRYKSKSRGLSGATKLHLRRFLKNTVTNKNSSSGKVDCSSETSQVALRTDSRKNKLLSGAHNHHHHQHHRSLFDLRPAPPSPPIGDKSREEACEQQGTRASKPNKVIPRRPDSPPVEAHHFDSTLKWPPAPAAITRAISQPDFVALQSGSHQSLNGNSTRHSNDELPTESGPGDFVPDIPDDQTINTHGDGNTSENLVEKEETHYIMSNDYEPDSVSSLYSDGTKPVKCSRLNHQSKSSSQHHHLMLDQCLSQLKLHHKHQQVAPWLSSKSNSNEISDVRGICNASSNELLQHQLQAGELPLKPSLIKQHQLALGKTLISPLVLNHNRAAPTGGQRPIASDSIGSASSLVQRNSSSVSGGSSSRATPRSSGESSSRSFSTYSSSGELHNAKNTLHNDTTTSSSSPSYETSCSESQSQLVSSNKMHSSRMAPPSNGATELTIETFLSRHGLADLSKLFEREKIDLEALMLLSEQDLKSIHILLGPRRKLLKAIDLYRHQHALATNGERVAPELVTAAAPPLPPPPPPPPLSSSLTIIDTKL